MVLLRIRPRLFLIFFHLKYLSSPSFILLRDLLDLIAVEVYSLVSLGTREQVSVGDRVHPQGEPQHLSVNIGSGGRRSSRIPTFNGLRFLAFGKNVFGHRSAKVRM